jgi:hypothetical protein
MNKASISSHRSQVDRSAVQYETAAEAYRDLEQTSGRLALVDRLATLLHRHPGRAAARGLYLCQA